MSGNVVQFPSIGDAITPEEEQDHLDDLHSRLVHALMTKQRIPDRIRMVLSIDDVMFLCELIEQKLGPEWFADSETDLE